MNMTQNGNSSIIILHNNKDTICVHIQFFTSQVINVHKNVELKYLMLHIVLNAYDNFFGNVFHLTF